MIKKVIKPIRKYNNKGFSLVELIIAVTIGSIVAGSVAALISFSLKVFHNESVNTSMQYEIQTSLNQVMDTIMSSQGMVIGQNSATDVSSGKAYTDYAAFGDFKKQGDGTFLFDGVVLVSGPLEDNKFNIYMDRVTDQAGATELVAVQAAVTNIKNNFTQDPNPYLLGQFAKSFRIEPKKDASGKYINLYTNAGGERVYTNPITIEVELDFEKDGTGKTIHKHVKDETYMRNTVKTDIYIGVIGSEVSYKYSKEN